MALVDERPLTLDPHQRALVARHHPGPALLTGGPGTGKTVVALHRLAAHATGRLLYLTPTSVLARVQSAAYRALPGAPYADFRSIGAWAADFVLRTGVAAVEPVTAALTMRLPRYDVVVVDEAQELTTAELRLAHALGGDGLLLVSAAPPVGWLTGSGIELTGGIDVLTVNYRNSSAVLAAARWCDVEERTGRPVGTALRFLAACSDEHDAELVAAVRRCPVPLREIAVLAAGRAGAAYYRRVLQDAQLAAVDLAAHSGPAEAVRVGAVASASGLEYAAVFVPDLRALPQAAAVTAITRARTYL